MPDLKRKPCPKCPYKLGLIQTVQNPCPECKLNSYQSYEWFQKQLTKNGSCSQNEDITKS